MPVKVTPAPHGANAFNSHAKPIANPLQFLKDACRSEIEKMTKRKVAIVYGSLPPETRAQQARLFNDPDNDYDFLVASDAVGMGLNLAIKRIIFETSHKFDGFMRRKLAVGSRSESYPQEGAFHRESA